MRCESVVVEQFENSPRVKFLTDATRFDAYVMIAHKCTDAIWECTHFRASWKWK